MELKLKASDCRVSQLCRVFFTGPELTRVRDAWMPCDDVTLNDACGEGQWGKPVLLVSGGGSMHFTVFGINTDDCHSRAHRLYTYLRGVLARRPVTSEEDHAAS